MAMKRVLVAGATGYLGSYVAQELKARGHWVRVVARSPGRFDSGTIPVDEIVAAEITRPATLARVCDGVDVVFSSVGITRQKDGLSFHDVDYQGNANLLEAALAAGVQRFVYVSVFNGRQLRHLDIVKAHEDFVDELRASGIGYAVLRPTGYFSDLVELLDMALKGRVWLFGSGACRCNPIHGADLAVSCADAIDGGPCEVDVGGPRVMSWNEMAEMAFRALGRPPRIARIPAWLAWTVVRLLRPFNRHQAELLAFFTTMATTELVAPATGSRTLDANFSRLGGGR